MPHRVDGRRHAAGQVVEHGAASRQRIEHSRGLAGGVVDRGGAVAQGVRGGGGAAGQVVGRAGALAQRIDRRQRLAGGVVNRGDAEAEAVDGGEAGPAKSYTLLVRRFSGSTEARTRPKRATLGPLAELTERQICTGRLMSLVPEVWVVSLDY